MNLLQAAAVNAVTMNTASGSATINPVPHAIADTSPEMAAMAAPRKPYDFDAIREDARLTKGQVPAFQMRNAIESMAWMADKCTHQSLFETFGTLLTKVTTYAHIKDPGVDDSKFVYHLWQGKPILVNGTKRRPFMISIVLPHGEVLHLRLRVNAHNLIIAVEVIDTVKPLAKAMTYSVDYLRQMLRDATTKKVEAEAKASHVPLAHDFESDEFKAKAVTTDELEKMLDQVVPRPTEDQFKAQNSPQSVGIY